MKDYYSMTISAIVVGALLFWHWEATLVSYLSTRKTVTPFTSVEELYLKTNFRLALMPSSSKIKHNLNVVVIRQNVMRLTYARANIS